MLWAPGFGPDSANIRRAKLGPTLTNFDHPLDNLDQNSPIWAECWSMFAEVDQTLANSDTIVGRILLNSCHRRQRLGRSRPSWVECCARIELTMADVGRVCADLRLLEQLLSNFWACHSRSTANLRSRYRFEPPEFRQGAHRSRCKRAHLGLRARSHMGLNGHCFIAPHARQAFDPPTPAARTEQTRHQQHLVDVYAAASGGRSRRVIKSQCGLLRFCRRPVGRPGIRLVPLAGYVLFRMPPVV